MRLLVRGAICGLVSGLGTSKLLRRREAARRPESLTRHSAAVLQWAGHVKEESCSHKLYTYYGIDIDNGNAALSNTCRVWILLVSECQQIYEQ